MKRLSVIGIALVAALALSAAAGAAIASASQFRAQQYPTAVSASQGTVQKLSLPGLAGSANFKCTSATATATEAAASSKLELAPSYSGCTFEGLQATISTNGCHLTYTSTSESAPYTGTFGISCSGGAKIEIKLGSCVVSIPAQSGLSGLEFANAGSGSNRTITTTYGVSGISYTGGSGCQANLVGSFSNGTLSGSSVLKGVAGLRQIGIYLGNAQVENGSQFQAASYPAFVKTTAPTSFNWTLNGVSMKCSTNSGRSVLASSSTELQQSMTFAGCTMGGLEWNVAMNGCKLADYVSQAEGAGYVGGREVACPNAGQEITLTQGGCVVSFPAQNVPGSVTYSNGEAGGLKNISASFNATGLKYTGGSGCASNLVGSHENGAMTGGWTLTGYIDAGGLEGEAISDWIQ